MQQYNLYNILFLNFVITYWLRVWTLKYTWGLVLEFCGRSVQGLRFLRIWKNSFNGVNIMVQSANGMSNARIIGVILKQSDKVLIYYRILYLLENQGI